MAEDEPVSEALERYLEAIYILEHTGGAIAARVAERLGVRAPSVSAAIRRMEARGWVEAGPARRLALTPAGRRLAEQIMRRHRVLERWLVEGLGLGWARAHSEAQKMEHAVSAEVIDRLYEALGEPAACPHGNPIPGPRGLPPYGGSVTLDRVSVGAGVRVVRIAEDAEESADALERFDGLGLRPGRRVRVLAPAAGGVRLDAGEGAAELTVAMAGKVWVELEA